MPGNRIIIRMIYVITGKFNPCVLVVKNRNIIADIPISMYSLKLGFFLTIEKIIPRSASPNRAFIPNEVCEIIVLIPASFSSATVV